MKFWLISFIGFLLTSCSSWETRQQEFNEIQTGMVKSEVIAIAGAPYWSDRKKGQDRWIYYMNPKDREGERIVYFEDNKVVSKGGRNKPLLSAEEMESLKKQPVKTRPHKRKVSDKELRQIIKKELKKKKPVKKDRFEKL